MHNEKTAAIKISLAASLLLIALKFIAGTEMHSAGVISEALHSLLDLLASGFAFISIWKASKPEDDKHPHGYGKMEDIAAIVEGGLIFCAGVAIIYKAITGVGDHRLDDLDLGIAVMFVSAGVNFAVSRYLAKVAKRTESVALAADSAHLKTDVATSLGVFVGLVLVRLTGVEVFDSVAAMIVAVMIIHAGWGLIVGSVANVLDARLPDHEQDVIHAVLKEHSEFFYEFHKLRTRKSGHRRYIDLHLLVPRYLTVEEGHRIGHVVSDCIESRLLHSKALIHIEPCSGACEACVIDCKRDGEPPA